MGEAIGWVFVIWCVMDTKHDRILDRGADRRQADQPGGPGRLITRASVEGMGVVTIREGEPMALVGWWRRHFGERACTLCGRHPAAGYAFIGERRYCHPDTGWSCFTAALNGVTPEQLAALPVVCPTCNGTGEVGGVPPMGDSSLPSGYVWCEDPTCEAHQMPPNADGTYGYRHAHPEGSTWATDRESLAQKLGTPQ